jgi:ribosomal peptide maturation radical SAM protein 1
VYRISLVNLPFAPIHIPSLALLQLQAVTERACGSDVRIRIIDATHDTADFLGIELYTQIAGNLDANMAGLGDWFFRECAFPQSPHNEQAYFMRFFRTPGTFVAVHRDQIRRKRHDAGQLLGEIIDRYQLDEDDLVGFTSMFCQTVAACAMARELKRRAPRIITVMGGANCESPMGEAIVEAVDVIDFVFSGPALKSFPALVAHLVAGEDPARHAINGVLSKRNTSRDRRHLPMAGHSDCAGASALGDERDINEPLEVDYTPFLAGFEARFGGKLRPSLPFETSRGCWWGAKAHCTFCGLNGQSMAYRAMQPDLAVAQFQRLFGYAGRLARLQSVDNILPREYLTEVLPRLSPPDSIHMFYEVKADLSLAELKVLARAHVTEIQPGIEALSTSTLKLMKKGTSAFQNVSFIKHCMEVGIRPDWNLLVGFPGEQESVYEKYLRDIPRLTHLPPPHGAFPIRFDRFSPYYMRAREYGLDLHAHDWYRFVYPFDDGILERLAYYFLNHDVGAGYLHAVAKHLRSLQRAVADWRAAWNDTARRPALVLRDESGSSVVSDSRPAFAGTHVLTESQVRILRELTHPQRVDALTTRFGQSASSDVRYLLERGLLFEEDGRLLALLADGDLVAADPAECASGSEMTAV